MQYKDLREIHDLMFSTMGLFHEKFLHRFPKDSGPSSGIKKNHRFLIGFLYQHPFLTATELAKAMNMEKGSLTPMIDQLSELGLIKRSEDPNDRRKTLISLTEAGRQEMEDVMNVSVRRISEILNDKDPDELREFIASLRYIVAFMQGI